MDKLVDFIMSYLREVAYFFRHISDLSLWNSDSLIAVAEYIFIGWIALLVIPRLFFRNALLQLVAKILIILLLIGLLLWANDPNWYQAYL